jgi:hypothetical protein
VKLVKGEKFVLPPSTSHESLVTFEVCL